MLKTSREKVVKNAEKYVSRGKIEAGIKEYRKLLDENPNDISTLNRVGDLYARIQRNSEAIELFHQIAEQYAEDGFLVKAIAIYKKIIKLDPTLLEIYEQLADLYHRQGLVNEARTQYQVLADYYLKHDKPASAISVYERMVQLESDNPSHRVRLAELYQAEDLVDKALGEYRAIADLMLEHGRGEEAAQVYERGLAVSSEDIGFITDGVLKLKEEGHVGAAAKFLTLAVQKNPQAQRVARIAGLGEGDERAASSAAGEAPVIEGEEAEQVREEDVLSPVDEVEPTEEDVDTRELDEPTVREASPAASEAGPLEDEDLEDFEIELPGGEEGEPGSLVQPPADMLEDRERPGAAWDLAERPGAAGEPTPPEAAGSEREGEAPAAPVSEGTFEFELDLEADSEELLERADEAAAEMAEPAFLPSAEPPPGLGPEPEDSGIDHDLLERTAAEVHAQPSSDPEDLFTEAEVLARYGIHEKALERLADLLHRDPRHLQGYLLMVGIHLDAGRHERVCSVAGRMAEVAAEVGDEEIWPELRDRLAASGYAIDGTTVRPPEGVPAEPGEEAPEQAPDLAAQEDATEEEVIAPEAEEIQVELDEDRFELPEVPAPEVTGELAVEEEPSAVEEEPAVASPAQETSPADEAPSPPQEPAAERAAAAKTGPAPRRKKGDVDAALEELASGLLGRVSRRPRRKPAGTETPQPRSVEPAASAEPPREAPPESPAQPPSEPAAPAVQPPAPASGGPVDPLRALGESLREEIDVGGDEGEPLAAQGQDPDDTGMSWLDQVSEEAREEDLFAGEEDFFDLGAELEQELSADSSFDEEEELLLSSTEQSLEDIVEGFKRGVAENLSSEDYDTHFNLGIAYREMGLLDEAIGEFQLAAKHPDYLVTCASMLGLCFLEKGLPELAVKWYQRGLEAPEIAEEDRLGLLYDLGNAQAAGGDSETAYHTFVDLYGINTNYRDVVARLAELEPSGQGGDA